MSDNESDNSNSDDNQPMDISQIDVASITIPELEALDVDTLKEVCKSLQLSQRGGHDVLVKRILTIRSILTGEGRSANKGKKHARSESEDETSEHQEQELRQKLLKKKAKSIPADNGMQEGGGSDDENSGSDSEVFVSQGKPILMFPEELLALLPKNPYKHTISKSDTKTLNKNQPLPDKIVPPPPALQEELRSRLSKLARHLDKELRTYTFKILDILRPVFNFWKRIDEGEITSEYAEDMLKQIIERTYAAMSELTILRRRMAVKDVSPTLENAVRQPENSLLEAEDFEAIKKSAKFTRILDFASRGRNFRPRGNFNGFRGNNRGRGRHNFNNRGRYNNFRRGRGGYNNYSSFHNNNNNNKKPE